MDKTEKRTAEDMLKEKGIIKGGYSKWICRFEDGNEFDIGALISEYAAQELDAYKTKLKELLLKRKQEYHKDCLTDAFINGRFWECQELLELIDKL